MIMIPKINPTFLVRHTLFDAYNRGFAGTQQGSWENTPIRITATTPLILLTSVLSLIISSLIT